MKDKVYGRNLDGGSNSWSYFVEIISIHRKKIKETFFSQIWISLEKKEAHNNINHLKATDDITQEHVKHQSYVTQQCELIINDMTEK